MTDEISDADKLEEVYHKLDDFEWLIRCFATCHFDEFDSDQFSAAVLSLTRIISDAKQEIASLIKKTYPNNKY